jgi:hypothetical protein
VLAPYGVVHLTADVRLGFDIRKALPAAQVIETDYRLRSSRRLTARALDLAAQQPDIVVVGGGFQDWIVRTRYNLPLIEIDEFSIRINWFADLFCEQLQIPVVFVFGAPIGDTLDSDQQRLHSQSVAEIYLRALEAVARRVDRFYLFNVNTHFLDLEDYPVRTLVSQPRKLPLGARQQCAAAFAACVRAALQQRGSSRMPGPIGSGRASARDKIIDTVQRVEGDDIGEWMLPLDRQTALPRRVVIETNSGQRHVVDDPAWLRWFALSIPEVGDEMENQGPDEGSTLKGKLLARLGGRNLFEKTTQFAICTWLRGHYRNDHKRVMIIGDSIRMRIADGTGYGIVAYRHLVDRCNLIHVPHNCGSSRVGLTHLESWLQAKPHIIHYNHGLHDLALNPKDNGPAPTYSSPRDYETNLRRIVEIVRARSEAILIWGLCTPVDDVWHRFIPNKDNRVRSIFRTNDDVRRYNDVARKVMDEYAVPVTDLFSPLHEAGVRSVVLADGVHLNSRGAAIAGRLVADSILAHLEPRDGAQAGADAVVAEGMILEEVDRGQMGL